MKVAKILVLRNLRPHNLESPYLENTDVREIDIRDIVEKEDMEEVFRIYFRELLKVYITATGYYHSPKMIGWVRSQFFAKSVRMGIKDWGSVELCSVSRTGALIRF